MRSAPRRRRHLGGKDEEKGVRLDGTSCLNCRAPACSLLVRHHPMQLPRSPRRAWCGCRPSEVQIDHRVVLLRQAARCAWPVGRQRGECRRGLAAGQVADGCHAAGWNTNQTKVCNHTLAPRQRGGMCSGSVGSGRSVPSVSAPRPAGHTAASCKQGVVLVLKTMAARAAAGGKAEMPPPTAHSQPELPTQRQGAGADGQHCQLDLLCRSALCITNQRCRQQGGSTSSSICCQESKPVLPALPPPGWTKNSLPHPPSLLAPSRHPPTCIAGLWHIAHAQRHWSGGAQQAPHLQQAQVATKAQGGGLREWGAWVGKAAADCLVAAPLMAEWLQK